MQEAKSTKPDDWIRSLVPDSNATKPITQKQDIGVWIEIRLFISSTFVDTQAERDCLVKMVIPALNRKLAPRLIRFIPVDLRWGVSFEDSSSCKAIQKTCLNQIDKCRQSPDQPPWFLGLRTERYGWVQDDFMASEGFENPSLFGWMNKFIGAGKQVSITSLECIHAIQVPEALPEFPTILFYNRVCDKTNLEPNLEWIYDFEYVSPTIHLPEEVKYQYNSVERAPEYQSDLNSLNDRIKQLSHVKWSDYSCKYYPGDAFLTVERHGAKSFGVGYVHELSSFEHQVQEDLLQAVDKQFPVIDMSKYLTWELEALQHRRAIKDKASTFVGREAMVDMGAQHCLGLSLEEVTRRRQLDAATERKLETVHAQAAEESPSSVSVEATSMTVSTKEQANLDAKARNPNSNLLIFHGEPGCGKSGLVAAICAKLINSTPDGFLCFHLVDSCPSSNSLQQMLIRLQLALRNYCRALGDNDLSIDSPQTLAALRKEHHELLCSCAARHPDKQFIIIIDAVNQFYSDWDAWHMWWLPSDQSPPNLRVMISTLDKENSTFDNAIVARPDALRVPVGPMSEVELQTMVNASLARFNKKLCSTDDKFLGNQMSLLLSKNHSPLYLAAACSALRCFGIFEKVTEYIKSLPGSIESLFSFLIADWSHVHGELFIRDVLSFLCSCDGLLENEINDLLRFKESKLTQKGKFLYESSFSRLYDSLESFLAAGGGGYLRFFHDQLKFAVRRTFLSDLSASRETHSWLVQFFISVIESQLVHTPAAPPIDYYPHVLNMIVGHQIAAFESPFDSFLSTLRNIYFVRERIKYGQDQRLNDDYQQAIEACREPELVKNLREWAKFVQIYKPAIQEFPDLIYNMAANQHAKGAVYLDSISRPNAPQTQEGFL